MRSLSGKQGRTLKHMEALGVRITPGIIHFSDVRTSVTQVITVQIHNISLNTKQIRVYPPKSDDLKLMDESFERPIAAGMKSSVGVKLHLRHNSADFEDRLVITIDGETRMLPIVVSVPKPYLDLPEKIDFGKLVLQNRIVKRKILIKNRGSVPGHFRINENNEKIKITPSYGVVPPKSSETFTISFLPEAEQIFTCSIPIELEGSQKTPIEITANVVQPHLTLKATKHDKELFSRNLHAENIVLVKVGPIFYNAARVFHWTIVNQSPEPSKFVCVLSDELNQTIRTGNEQVNLWESSVKMYPPYGELQPYEELPMKLRIRPRLKPPSQGFINNPKKPPSMPFALCVRVHIVEPSSLSHPQISNRASCPSPEILITGRVVPVQVSIEPFTQVGELKDNVSHEGSYDPMKTISEPGGRILMDFGQCIIGKTRKMKFYIKNRSAEIPLAYFLPGVAHFQTGPSNGHIPPNDRVAIDVTFTPNQCGAHSIRQQILLLDDCQLNDNTKPKEVIFKTYVTLSGSAVLEAIKPAIKFNPGIVPLVSNEVGFGTDIMHFGSNLPCPRLAVINQGKTLSLKGLPTHAHQEWRKLLEYRKPHSNTDDFKCPQVAFPNDRATSIRPGEKEKLIRTIFCRLPRYKYLDMDYQLSGKKLKLKLANTQFYAELIRKHTEKNIQKRIDSRLAPWQAEPHHGFIPFDMEKNAFCITVDLTRKEDHSLREGKKKHETKTMTLMTAEGITSKRLKALEKREKALDAKLNAAKEKEFTEALSANELYQVSLSPSSIDFGDLCRGTTKTHQVQLNNPTTRQFLVRMDVEDKTVCHTPLPTFLVKPLTTTEIPLTVQCRAIGRVQYNANFSINGQYYKTVLITANGVSRRLEVNPPVLELDLTHFQSRTNKGCGLRARVELFNPLNVSTAFSWEQLNEDTSFSIHCDKGTVEPFSSLVCEVVHRPSFNTPKKQTFRLKVHDEPPDNNTVLSTLHSNYNLCEQVDLLCVVKLPPSVAVFAASNLSLGSIAYALPVKRMIRINSVGHAPAFCRIRVDDKVKPKHAAAHRSAEHVDCSIKPVDFEVPAGGHVDVEVVCTPYFIGKFEKIVVLHGRGGRKTSCCISGTVAAPQIRSLTTLSKFNGVYVGGSADVPLEFENYGSVEAVLSFNLSKYPDFMVLSNASPTSDGSPRKSRKSIRPITECASGDGFDKTCVNGIQPTDRNLLIMQNELNLCTNIQLSPGTKWSGHLRFSPTEVAVYDFNLPVKINNVSAFQEQSDGSVTKHCCFQDISHRVLAIGLRQPVDIYPVDRCVQFNFPLKMTPGVAIAQQQQSFGIKAVRNQPIFWALDLNEVQRFNKEKLGIISIDREKGSVCTSTVDELIDGSFSNSTDEERFTIRFSPRKAGCFILRIPVLILKPPGDITDGKTNQPSSSRFTPFTDFKLLIRVTKPSICCFPPRILLPPVPPDFEICFPIELVYQDLPLKIKLSVCWCAHDQTTPTECKQMTPSSCPFVIDIPNGQLVDDGASTIIKANSGRIQAWFRLKSSHDGLLIRPHPKPCCLVFVVQPDENVNSKSSSPLIPSAVRVTVPVSLAVDRSFLSWFQYVNWYPEGFDAIISSLPQQGKTLSLQGDSHVYPSAKEMQLKADESTSTMKSGLLADFRTVDDQRDIKKGIDPHEMLVKTPSSPDDMYKERNSIPGSQLSSRKSIMAKHYQSDAESAEGIFGRHWQYCDRRTSECVRRWIQNQNFPGSNQMLSFPDDFRKCASFTACLKKHKPSVISDNGTILASSPQPSDQEKPRARTYFSHNIGLLYQLLVHLCGGTAPPGVQPSISLNTERPFDALTAVYSFLSSLLTFVNSQGGCLPHVVPQHLMDPQDYEAWHALGFPGLTKSGRCIRLTERSLCDPRRSALSASVISKRSESTSPVSSKSERDKTQRGPYKQSLLILPIQPLPKLTRQEFESVSIRAWTDLMLQLIKCLVVERLEPSNTEKVRQPFRTAAYQFSWTEKMQFNDTSSAVRNWLPEMENSIENGSIKPEPSTCISTPTKQLSTLPVLSRCSNNEAAVLHWVNYCYHHGRQTVWSREISSQKVPMPRVIGNFDTDFSDGVVLACLIGSYVPSLIPDFISKVCTQPKTDEQRLHNAIQTITALGTICLDYGLLPSDIINPHPLEMLLLCVQLFRTLPDHTLCQCVQFSGPHQVMCKREIILTNPSSSPLTYKCFLLGKDAVDFTIQPLPSGNHRTKTDAKNGRGIQCGGPENNQVLANVPANSSIRLGVTYRSRFLRKAEATLLAVCQSGESINGRNLSFALVGNVSAIGPAPVVDVTSPCYTAKEFSVSVCNPYLQAGTFSITKVESEDDFFAVIRDFNHKPASDGVFVSDINFGASSDKKEPNDFAIPKLQAFFCRQKSAYLCTQFSLPKESDTGQLNKSSQFFSEEKTSQTESSDNSSITMIFLPLELAKSSCCLLFRNEKVGEFFVIVRGYAELPEPSPLTFPEPDITAVDRPIFKGNRLSSATAAACFGLPGDSNVIYLRVPVKQTVKETLLLPVQNEARNKALAHALQLKLETAGQKRTEFLSSLSYNDLLDLAANLLALPASPLDTNSTKTRIQTKQRNCDLVYEMDVNLKSVKVTSKVEIRGEQCESGLPVHIPLDLEICIERTGLIPAEILVRGPSDVRVYRVDCLAVPDNAQITFNFSAPVHQSVVQAIPINNQTDEDWHLRAEFTGAVEWFSGPSKIVAPSKQVTDYTVNFMPYRETTVAAQLNLINMKNGIVQNFLLNGSGLPPKSQGQLKFSFRLDCSQELSDTEKSIALKQNIKLFPFSVKVPNPTSRTQHYKLESTFPAGAITCSCEEGTSGHLVVFPGQTAECFLYFRASKSGSFSGTLAFVSKGGPTKSFRTAPMDQEESSDDDFKLDADVSNQADFSFRIWYELVVDVDAGPPVKKLEIVAPCLGIKPVEIPFSLPSEPLGTSGDITVEVTLDGPGLHGSSEYILDSSTTKNPIPYRFEFRPAVVGDSKGRITFFHPLFGEFWVALLLRTTKPEDVHVQPITCELGKSVITTILLENPSDEPCVLTPHIGNTEAFALQMNVSVEPLAHAAFHSDSLREERFSDSTIPTMKSTTPVEGTSHLPPVHLPPNSLLLEARSAIQVGLKFTPFNLGTKGHEVVIRFLSKKLIEWRYFVSGCGVLPKAHKPVYTYAEIGSASTVLVPVSNPFHNPVCVDVLLTQSSVTVHQQTVFGEPAEQAPPSPVSQGIGNDHQATDLVEPFQLLLRSRKGIVLQKGACLTIPIAFEPKEMRQYSATCSVVLRSPPAFQRSPVDQEVAPREPVEWVIPLKGIAEATSPLNCTILSDRKMDHSVVRSPSLPTRCSNVITGVVGSTTKYQLCLYLCSDASEVKGSLARPSLLPNDRPATIEIRPLESAYSAMEPKCSESEEPFIKLKMCPSAKSHSAMNKIREDKNQLVPTGKPRATDSAMINKLLESSLQILLERIGGETTTGFTEIQLILVFTPSHPFKCTAQLTVATELGGIWKFAMIFEAQEPPADNVIILPMRSLGKTVTATLSLASDSAVPEPFVATLRPSNDEFKITPQSGLLPTRTKTPDDKYNGETPIAPPALTIALTPIRYGKQKVSELTVETPTKLQRYQLIGDVPCYIPPTKAAMQTTGKALDALARTKLLTRKKRNFILHNQCPGRHRSTDSRTNIETRENTV
ncbi:hypothetical protein CRM22_006034 [Opisthorchis felineus]|uniref:Calponin-homology (CH) domain-containing protein n=1 Tax=Opisthorchis felineus TaxID=147828 RepID=A0A4S2LUC6_OPIFE|nr:hypothetical protein CRM22_006034 [Opisthorchis felineus]